MNFLNSILHKSKKHQFPFDHWEYNNALSEEAIKENKRFKKFFELFKSLNIIKDLGNSIENWDYEKLNETDRISRYIKEKIKNYEFS